jgi:uncharacterized LabA/DUF88 family protein
MEQTARIALLIDADNAPSSKIDVILAELAKVGVSNIRRAYGNWKKDGLRGWEAVLHEYAIRPVQQFDYSKGKNATDMSMVIDAMDLLYTDRPEAFGIVSSDSDFTPLVMHLKAKGAQVFGFGAKKTPMPFVNAGSRFLYLENLGQTTRAEEAEKAPAVKTAARKSTARKTAKPAGRAGAAENDAANDATNDVTANSAQGAQGKAGTKSGAPNNGAPTNGQPEVGADGEAHDAAPLRKDTAALKQDARLVTLLRNAVEAAAGDDGWSRLGTVGKQIGNQASFDPRNYGYPTLSKLIAATQLFETRDEGTSTVAIRDKRLARRS